ncbi:MAG: hypothetical protein KDC08_05815 [Actinobacteria bacterium]|nr:hypothetical protein [Actinomycetota bacterium]
MTTSLLLPERTVTLTTDGNESQQVVQRGGQDSIVTERPDGTHGTKRPRTREETERISFTEQGRNILASRTFWDVAFSLPGNTRQVGKRGAPAHYPAWVYLFLVAMTTVHGSQNAAITHVCSDRHLWRMYRRYAHKHLPDGWDKAPKQPPKRHHLNYFLKRWRSQQWAAVRQQAVQAFRQAALTLANDLGHLPTGKALYYKRPCPSQWVAFDGTVYPGPTNNRPDKGKRYDSASGWHNKYGKEKTRVWGSKIVFASMRSEDYHGRIILDFTHVLGPNNISGIGDEGKAIVTVAKRIHAHAPGMRGVIVDGVLRDLHITELSADNLHTINLPAAKTNTDRKTKGTRNSSRVEKRHKVTVHRHTRSSGRTCEHHIWAIGGQLHEQVRSGDNGKPVWVPLTHDRVSTRPNSDGTWRHYIHATLHCHNHPVEFQVPLHHQPDTGPQFKRGEYLRYYPPGSWQYGVLYGRRNDTESLHREMKREMPRLPGYGTTTQELFILGYALRNNAVTENRAKHPEP